MNKVLETIDMLKVLKENPTFKAINSKGCIVGTEGDEKYINVKNTGYDRMSLNDKWSIISPISYEKANELFKHGRMIECIFQDGTRKQYRKMPIDSNVIIESGIPILENCLYYCYWE